MRKGLFLLGALYMCVAINTVFAADTVYDHLGGKKTGMKNIKKVVDDFVGTCTTDDRIKSFFAKTAADPKRLAKFKKNLTDQICQAVGGPCKYKGKSMKDAHQGMGIGEADFNALVENLSNTLTKDGVKDEDKTAILNVLGPMKTDVVEQKG
jgi:hemoglobin